MFSDGFNLQAIIMMVPGVLMGFTFHEFGHALVATLLGDDTPRLQGRVTLDPRAHLDLWGTILIFIAQFGWAKPVQTNPSKIRPSVAGNIAVALAGVTMNFLLAVIFYAVGLLFARGLIFGYHNRVLVDTIEQIVWMNIIMIGFNLIPLPPLDGFHVVRWLLPRSLDGLVSTLYRFGPLVAILLFAVPSFVGRVMDPIYGGIVIGVKGTAMTILHLFLPTLH